MLFQAFFLRALLLEEHLNLKHPYKVDYHYYSHLPNNEADAQRV